MNDKMVALGNLDANTGSIEKVMGLCGMLDVNENVKD